MVTIIRRQSQANALVRRYLEVNGIQKSREAPDLPEANTAEQIKFKQPDDALDQRLRIRGTLAPRPPHPWA